LVFLFARKRWNPGKIRFGTITGMKRNVTTDAAIGQQISAVWRSESDRMSRTEIPRDQLHLWSDSMCEAGMFAG
jgi:hypothetical protein